MINYATNYLDGHLSICTWTITVACLQFKLQAPLIVKFLKYSVSFTMHTSCIQLIATSIQCTQDIIVDFLKQNHLFEYCKTNNLPCSFQERVKNAKIVYEDARSTAIDYPRNSSVLKSRCLQYGHICQFPPAHTQNKRLNFCPIGREVNSLGRGHYCQNHSAFSLSATTEKEQKKI